MYRLQSQQLATARVGSLADDPAKLREQINSVFDHWQNVLTACGPLEHDTDGKPVEIRGNSDPAAGKGTNAPILTVTQENPLAGTTDNPNLEAVLVNGPLTTNGPATFRPPPDNGVPDIRLPVDAPLGFVAIAAGPRPRQGNPPAAMIQLYLGTPNATAPNPYTYGLYGSESPAYLTGTTGTVTVDTSRTGLPGSTAILTLSAPGSPLTYSLSVLGPVSFAVPPQVMFVGTTTAKWASGSPPTVAATHSTLGAISIRLASTTTQDPNYRSGETIVFSKGDDGNYYAFDSHLDGKIGDAKWWVGAFANVPPGWRVLTTVGAGTVTGKFPRISNSSTLADAGTTGGAATHAHTFSGSSAGGTASISMSGSTGTGTASISMSGSTASGTASITMSGSTASGGTGSTGSATTGITVNTTDITITTATDTAVGGIGTRVVSITTNPHSHAITEPDSGAGHFHAGPSHTHASGTLAATDSGHTHTAGTLAATDAGHTHTAGTLAATDAGHTHGAGSYAVADGDNIPPYIYIGLIERFE